MLIRERNGGCLCGYHLQGRGLNLDPPWKQSLGIKHKPTRRILLIFVLYLIKAFFYWLSKMYSIQFWGYWRKMWANNLKFCKINTLHWMLPVEWILYVVFIAATNATAYESAAELPDGTGPCHRPTAFPSTWVATHWLSSCIHCSCCSCVPHLPSSL